MLVERLSVDGGLVPRTLLLFVVATLPIVATLILLDCDPLFGARTFTLRGATRAGVGLAFIDDPLVRRRRTTLRHATRGGFVGDVVVDALLP